MLCMDGITVRMNRLGSGCKNKSHKVGAGVEKLRCTDCEAVLVLFLLLCDNRFREKVSAQ